jgi:FRG domain
MVEEVRVSSWLELQERLFEESWKEQLGRFRSDLAFRGHADTDGELTTSLARLGGDYTALENHLLRNFRKYARRDAVAVDTTWDWLSLAKHHHLPTRVLDWSYSPYVALHFATVAADRLESDGAVWCVDYVRARDHLPEKLQRLLAEEGSNVFTTDMLARVAGSLGDLDSQPGGPFVLFFEPPSLDERIVNQYALFSLMSSPSARLDAWLAEHPGLARKIVVPADLKWEVRDKLDQANVTERVLFPGLDGLSAWLRRHYSPRTGAGAPSP